MVHTNDTEPDVSFEPTDSEGVELHSKQKVKKTQTDLETIRKERDEYLDLLQRSRADYINLLREEERKRGDLRQSVIISIMRDLLPVMDSFDAAMKNQSVWESVPENWRIGVKYIRDQLQKTFSEYGVNRIEALNQVFDPNIHEPIKHEQVTDPLQDNTVIEIIRAGYTQGESVLRPAQVIVGNYQQ